MSNDRELLEMAAKAAGLECEWVKTADDETLLHAWSDACCMEWNPLVSDGDALRLAVKLGIEIEFFSSTVYAGPRRTAKYAVDEEHELDMASATRRAIVMAAAEIGRAKP